jgi:asparagine synthase (glutamine-hydrolysing)
MATRYARTHGHSDPVPLTLQHPGLASSEHLALQERVIAHLGLADWERVEPEDLDLAGPVAGGVLRRTGPLWPPHAYVMAPLLEASRGGVFVLLTGVGDFFAWWRWAPLAGVLAGHRRPTARDARLLAAMLLPASVRASAARRRGSPPPMPWLRPAPERDALRLLRARRADVPTRCDRAMTTQVTHRCFTGAAGTFRALGETLGTTTDLPLSRPGVVESLAGAIGWRGPASLGEMLRLLAGDLLPPDLLGLRSSPDPTPVFFGETCREFVANWTGEGLDESIIDVELLRKTWLSDSPDPRTACLLQFAWLTEQAANGISVPTTGDLLVTHTHNQESL